MIPGNVVVPELLGEFFWEDQQWIDESAASLTWAHGLQVLGYTELAFGDLADGVSGEMYSGCFLAEGICSDASLGEPDFTAVWVRTRPFYPV